MGSVDGGVAFESRISERVIAVSERRVGPVRIPCFHDDGLRHARDEQEEQRRAGDAVHHVRGAIRIRVRHDHDAGDDGSQECDDSRHMDDEEGEGMQPIVVFEAGHLVFSSPGMAPISSSETGS